MIISKKNGESVELEMEVRRLVDNFLVDLSTYSVTALLSDGLGGTLRIIPTIEKLLLPEQMGRFILRLTPEQTRKLTPSLTYNIDATYVELSSGYTECLKTVYLKIDGI